MSIRGEYWIQNGYVEFADGDIGDFNHEAIAQNYVAGQHIDKLFDIANYLEIDLNAFRNYEENPAYVFEQLYYKIFHTMLDSDTEFYNNQEKTTSELLKRLGVDLNTLNILNGRGDARLYVMQHDGWIAVRGDNIELYGIDKNKLQGIANGIGDILEQEGLDENEEIDFSLYDHKTKRSVNVPLNDLMTGSLFKPQTLPQTKSNFMVPTNGQKQYGRELWRGTSENFLGVNMKFSQWLLLRENNDYQAAFPGDFDPTQEPIPANLDAPNFDRYFEFANEGWKWRDAVEATERNQGKLLGSPSEEEIEIIKTMPSLDSEITTFSIKYIKTLKPKKIKSPQKKFNAQCLRCGNKQTASRFDMNAGHARCKNCGGFLHPIGDAAKPVRR